MDMEACGVDACALAGYKVFSRLNYGVAWVSPRLSTLPHEKLDGTADDFWELGTRDTGAFATFSEVVNYHDRLGSQLGDEPDRRQRLEQAGRAMAAQEAHLVDVAINGADGQTGIRDLPGAYIVGGPDKPHREGLVLSLIHI